MEWWIIGILTVSGIAATTLVGILLLTRLTPTHKKRKKAVATSTQPIVSTAQPVAVVTTTPPTASPPVATPPPPPPTRPTLLRRAGRGAWWFVSGMTNAIARTVVWTLIYLIGIGIVAALVVWVFHTFWAPIDHYIPMILEFDWDSLKKNLPSTPGMNVFVAFVAIFAVIGTIMISLRIWNLLFRSSAFRWILAMIILMAIPIAIIYNYDYIEKKAGELGVALNALFPPPSILPEKEETYEYRRFIGPKVIETIVLQKGDCASWPDSYDRDPNIIQKYWYEGEQVTEEEFLNGHPVDRVEFSAFRTTAIKFTVRNLEEQRRRGDCP